VRRTLGILEGITIDAKDISGIYQLEATSKIPLRIIGDFPRLGGVLNVAVHACCRGTAYVFQLRGRAFLQYQGGRGFRVPLPCQSVTSAKGRGKSNLTNL
jgi:hypothetical protein